MGSGRTKELFEFRKRTICILTVILKGPCAIGYDVVNKFYASAVNFNTNVIGFWVKEHLKRRKCYWKTDWIHSELYCLRQSLKHFIRGCFTDQAADVHMLAAG